MIRTWTVYRQFSPRPDGERRWDQACQLLVCRAGEGAVAGPAAIAEEEADARGSVCAGLDRSPGSGAGRRAAA